MSVYKDKKTGKWNSTFYYTDWTGKKVKKLKRGFETKKEAQEWEKHFVLEKASSLDMTFEDFYHKYEEDVRPKLRVNTWKSKSYVIENKILPYFKNLVMRDITPREIITWQNTMRSEATKAGTSFSGIYLRKMQAELSAIFNHAVKYYELPKNPVVTAGPLGQTHADEMLFWTREEYIPNSLVWEYLLKNDGVTPWGSDNKYLFSLYQGEEMGEEQSVLGEVDKDKIAVTGNSRFRSLCWNGSKYDWH